MIVFSGIHKSFAGVPALSGIDLTFAPAQVHGLLGENGAGKSTIMRLLTGELQPDTGTIHVAGRPWRVRSPADARHGGISMVHQHFALVPHLTVVEHVALVLTHGWGRIARQHWAAQITAQAASLGWQLDPHARIADLAIGQQQRVEIITALLALPRQERAQQTVILDEPTAVLTQGEIDQLLPAIRALAASGVTVFYISHKLGEIAQVCDDVTVLRRGRVVFTGPATTPSTTLAALMVGQHITPPHHHAQPAAVDAPVRLQLDQVTQRAGQHFTLDAVSLTVRAGEIVGIAGVEGNGQVPLVQAILGLQPPVAGRIWCDEPLGVLPDDRQREALVMDLSLAENLALRTYRQPPLSRWGWCCWSAWRDLARTWMADYDIRAASPTVPLTALSGGNQQKAVIAREFSRQPRVVLAVNPTRGLDLGAANMVLQRCLALRAAGAGILLIHSDLDELLAISDRVLVLSRGRLLPTTWPHAERAELGRLMVGATCAAE